MYIEVGCCFIHREQRLEEVQITTQLLQLYEYILRNLNLVEILINEVDTVGDAVNATPFFDCGNYTFCTINQIL